MTEGKAQKERQTKEEEGEREGDEKERGRPPGSNEANLAECVFALKCLNSNSVSSLNKYTFMQHV